MKKRLISWAGKSVTGKISDMVIFFDGMCSTCAQYPQPYDSHLIKLSSEKKKDHDQWAAWIFAINSINLGWHLAENTILQTLGRCENGCEVVRIVAILHIESYWIVKTFP